MKAWLKGGLIGGVIGLILIILNSFYLGASINILIYFLIMLILLPFFGIYSLYDFNNDGELLHRSGEFGAFTILSYFILVLFLFVIGAIIGWIIGKIKNRS